jgi:hypothetical protein
VTGIDELAEQVVKDAETSAGWRRRANRMVVALIVVTALLIGGAAIAVYREVTNVEESAAQRTEQVERIAAGNEATIEATQKFFTRIAIEACEANNIQDRTTLQLTQVVAEQMPSSALRRIEGSLREAIFPCEEFTRQFLRGVFRRAKNEVEP